jgi:perosamine synthetase
MIPVNEPLFGERELAYVRECVQTGWISSSGRFIEAFESAWAEYCGMKHAVAVSSGTAALQLAVACLDLDAGDEIILPTFTIISCAQAVIYNSGVPVLVDCDPRTWCMDVGQVASKIGPRTRAIMAVHIYGHPVDMDPLLELAEQHELVVIEDAAEAHGAEYLRRHGLGQPAWQRCGGMGDLSVFSFYANKPVTTGEGGMVVTNDLALAEKARWLRNLCFLPDRRFYHERLGFNFRMTNLQAAIGLAQVERIGSIVERKRQIGRAYAAELCEVPGLILPVEEPWAKQIYWMYGLVLKETLGLDAQGLANRLRQRGIETRPFFLGMHEQPVFRQQGMFRDERHPVAERLARRGLYLPSGLALTDDQLRQVCQSVREVLV